MRLAGRSSLSAVRPGSGRRGCWRRCTGSPGTGGSGRCVPAAASSRRTWRSRSFASCWNSQYCRPPRPSGGGSCPARAGAGALGLAAGDSPASDFAAVHGLYWLCANLAERKPLLLTVDDLQWVDGPSLSWLAYLGPRCAESAMLVVLTVREGDPRGRANSVAAAADDSSVHRIGLSALSMASVAPLVRPELGPTASAGFCSACWELAGGNPLYVGELLAAARNERLSGADDEVTTLRALASSAVGASVLGRLAGLGSDAVSLAQAL